jgi:hypothetical protein
MLLVKSSVRKAVQFSRLANSYRGNPSVQLIWEALAEQWSSLAAMEDTLSAAERSLEVERLEAIENATLSKLGIKALAG